MTNTHEAALDLAAHGWRVFPCIPTGPKAKAPLTTHGHLDATQEVSVIEAWWAKWPEAMIGAPVPNALAVLDIDPRHGGSYEALDEACGPLPETLTSWSGRGDGGRHLFWRRPAGELTSTKLPKGIDLKVGGKGYVILPPSIHPVSGEPYRWEIHDVASLPARAKALLVRPAADPWRQPRKGTGDGAPLVRLVLSLNEGERDRGLFWAACRAAETGILERIGAELIRAAVSRGLSEREARRTVASAAKAGGRR
jgi:bifunctional DNA primase/polymerase-like protein